MVLIEKGRQRVPVDGLYRFAKVLECEIVDLLPPLEQVFGNTTPRSANQAFDYDELSRRRLKDSSERQRVESVLLRKAGEDETRTGRKGKRTPGSNGGSALAR